MLDERILDLINKDIDGSILPAERAMLDEYRAKNPEVGKMEQELRGVAAALGTVRPVEAPVTLKTRIMQSIGPEPRREPLLRRGVAAVTDFFRAPSGVRVAYAFSFGIVAGIALFAAFANWRNPGSLEPADLTGTLIMGSSDNTVESGPVVSISGDRVNGAIATQFTKNIAILTVRVSSADNLRAEFTYDPTHLAVRAVQRGSGARADFSVTGNSVEVQSTGADGYTLYFDRKNAISSPVRVTLFSAGTQVFSRDIVAVPEAE